MSEADRDLVAAIRSELAAVDPSRPCDRRAEAAGLGTGRSARDASVARLLVRLGHAERGSNGARVAGRLPFEWTSAAEHCRIAWLRGLVLARGSLSLSASRAHLEFVVAADEAPVLAERLGELGLPASWRLRRGLGVVTWKSLETIAQFLRLAGAGASLLELEVREVSRALRGDLNRALNAESANLQRIVAAAGRQVAAIATLEADGRLAAESPTVRAVADARRLTPEATLGELAARLDLHRSTVQRALLRIERLAADDQADERPRSRIAGPPGSAAGPLRRGPTAGGAPRPRGMIRG